MGQDSQFEKGHAAPPVSEPDEDAGQEADGRTLRRGWTTGACATAATAAACSALFGMGFPDPVTIRLPGGNDVDFALSQTGQGAHGASAGQEWAEAAVVKDAGDDPDVTHGAMIRSRVFRGAPGTGIVFAAGPGVGTVTREGLPVPVGEPAINPVPRRMMTEAATAMAERAGVAADLVIRIGIDHGEELARKTMNGRLGILGGLSVLGTTGIVIPYSCAAWIASIHRGIDVARAAGLDHVAASTGDVSERAVARHYDLPEIALLDMGDFAGGTLKYLRRHPVARLTIAGGVAKLSKLAQGRLDLHSKRHAVDYDWLSARMADLGADDDLIAAIRTANTANQAVAIAAAAGMPLGDTIADGARRTALDTLGPECGIAVDVLVVDRAGTIVGRAGR
ncbi:cobalt-precorrin-5B (C(1))-methyltransferase [Fodinicurvata sp. EGI_FJ10296]|uniref:cobalt-precorrin-5B (C(1))-methyltransferase n=1 Tax=Fodinicurvata sp. EGI_FJ10296 TaxID=3231908 RepID=UPI003455090F